MTHQNRPSSLLILAFAVAAALFVITLQAVSAQNSTPTRIAEAQNVSDLEALRGTPETQSHPEASTQSAGTSPAGRSLSASSSSTAEGVQGVRFVHIATTDNTTENYTLIDHHLTNDNPSATIFATHNRTPGGVQTSVFSGSLGVWYSTDVGRWGIFDQYYSDTMPISASFNVLIPEPGANVFVHSTNALNTEDYYTQIDHALTNNNPDATLLVTQNWNPGGIGGVYNDHHYRVSYRPVEGRWYIENQDTSKDLRMGAAFNILVPEVGARGVFTHSSSLTSVSGTMTLIDHPLTNDNPNALLYTTERTGNTHATGWDDYPIGVWYDTPQGKWAIRNVNDVSMIADRAFNVLVPYNGTNAFNHRAITDTIVGNVTIIDHPLTNNGPDTFLFVTQNWNPGGGLGVRNDSAFGIGYWSTAGQWDIFNRPTTNTMPLSATFNVLVPNVDAGVFVHQATTGNTVGHQTFIDYPPTNDRPNAILFVTHNSNPGGGHSGIYNDHSIGVIYNDGRGEWGIFNQDSASVPVSATFNVMLPNSAANVFVHEATAENITSNWTYIDHSLSNGNPNALVFVTHNRNPGGGFGTLNDHAIGVWYSSGEGKWAIFNQDEVGMTEGAAFNVLIMPARVYLPLVMR